MITKIILFALPCLLRVTYHAYATRRIFVKRVADIGYGILFEILGPRVMGPLLALVLGKKL